MSKIQMQKTYDGVMVYKVVDNIAYAVDVVEINEYPKRRYPRYRVDYKGVTRGSLLTLTEAKKLAREVLKRV